MTFVTWFPKTFVFAGGGRPGLGSCRAGETTFALTKTRGGNHHFRAHGHSHRHEGQQNPRLWHWQETRTYLNQVSLNSRFWRFCTRLFFNTKCCELLTGVASVGETAAEPVGGCRRREEPGAGGVGVVQGNEDWEEAVEVPDCVPVAPLPQPQPCQSFLVLPGAAAFASRGELGTTWEG